MRKILFIISLAVLLIISFVLLRNGVFTQKDSILETDSLTQKERKQLQEKIIITDKDTLLSEAFFRKWEEASAEYARSHSNPMIDSIYQKVFTHIVNSFKKRASEDPTYKVENTKYIVLPCNLEIWEWEEDTVVEQSTEHANKNIKEAVIGNIHLIDGNYERVASGYYVPHIKSDKPVLYDFPTIHNLMEKYLNENEDEMKNRRKEIEDQNYIPIAPHHWERGWYFNSMPIIYRICIYHNKGVGVYTRTSWCAGSDYFLPAKSDEIIGKSSWIE